MLVNWKQEDGDDFIWCFVDYFGIGCYIVCKFVCCFIGDDLLQNVVDVVVVEFMQKWNNGIQICEMLCIIFELLEFQNIWGEKIKCFFDVVVFVL